MHTVADGQVPARDELVDGSPAEEIRPQMPADSVSTTGPGPHAVHVVEPGGHDTEVNGALDGSAVSAVHVVPVSRSAHPLPWVPTATQDPAEAQETDARVDPDTAEASVAFHFAAAPTSRRATPTLVVPTAAHDVGVGHDTEVRVSLVTPEGRGSTTSVQAPLASRATNA